MKTIKVNVYGVECDYEVPSTVEEYNQLAKDPNRALDLAIKQELYHGSYGKFRASITEALEEKGYERKVLEYTEKTDEETGEVTKEPSKYETDKQFFDRIVGETGKEPEDFIDVFEQAVKDNPFDPSVSVREAKPKKPSKSHIATAAALAEAGKLESVAAALANKLGIEVNVTTNAEGEELTSEQAITALARAIARNEREEKKNMADKYADLA